MNVPPFSPPSAPPLQRLIERAMASAGGWLGFDRFMALALYAPGLGYYSRQDRFIGQDPTQSDFVTAPTLGPWFGRTLVHPVRQALEHTGTDCIWEFGAGTGDLALQLLAGLGDAVKRYTIIELSGALRERQQATLSAHAHKVQWLSEWPEAIDGVVLGNEVMDAMPVQLLQRSQGQWHERGVVAAAPGAERAWAWQDRPSSARPPVDIEGKHDYLTEVHPQAEAFVRSLAERLQRSHRPGVVILLDYGFPESEYYHPQRHMGTVMCHRAHRADSDPLADVGLKDITAHVNFTGLALAAQDAGLQVLGYTSQANYLLNCGILPLLEGLPIAQRHTALTLIHEHEMGELFKVLVLGSGPAWTPMGFEHGDRTHAL